MANIKSAKKRIKVIATKTLRNKMIKTSLKNSIKKFEVAFASGDLEASKAAYTNAVRSLDMTVSKGVLHKNTASRKKSRLALRLNTLS